MVYDLAPSGEGATKLIRINNDQDHAITLEITVFERSIAPDGRETRKRADDDFVIFPPQTIVAPHTLQSVRVRYVGPTNFESTKMYVVSINQVPVQPEELTRTGVQFVVDFGTTAYVNPSNSKAALSVATVVPGAKGKVDVTIRNDGNRYASISLSKLTVRSGDGRVFDISGDPLRTAIGLSIVPPNGTRIFHIPAPAGFPRKGLTGQLDYQPVVQ